MVWGGGTSSSIYTIQLLQLAEYTNIIVTASPHTSDAAKAFGATHVFDYNDPEVVSKIKAVAGKAIVYGFDSVGTESSLKNMAELLTDRGARLGYLPPVKLGNVKNFSDPGATLSIEIPRDLKLFADGVELVPTYTFQWDKVRISPRVLETN